MTIAGARLLRHVVSQRLDQVQLIACTRHCDVQQPPLLVDSIRLAGCEFRREISVGDIQHVDRVPFLALGRMHGGQHQIILIQHRWPCELATRARRVERQLGQESFAARILSGQMLQHFEIGGAHTGRFVQARELRLVPGTHAFDLARPGGARIREFRHHPAKRRPGFRCGRRHIACRQLRKPESCAGYALPHARGIGRTHARRQLQHAKCGETVPGIVRPTQHREQVLDVCGFQKSQSPVLDVGDVGSHQFDLEPVAVVRTAKQHGLASQQGARFPTLQHALHDVIGLLAVVLHGHEPRSRAAATRGHERLAILAAAACNHRIRRIQQGLA